MFLVLLLMVVCLIQALEGNALFWPVFLYNTLESIRSEALIARLASVADMTEALADTISKMENLSFMLDHRIRGVWGDGHVKKSLRQEYAGLLGEGVIKKAPCQLM